MSANLTDNPNQPKQVQKGSHIIRIKAKINPDMIFNHIYRGKVKITLFGHQVALDTSSLIFFYNNGITCANCGITGTRFYLEKDIKAKHWRLHLYALNEKGAEREMTKDHIIPLSKGGPNKHFNLQPMCSKCNSIKGNTLTGKMLTAFSIKFLKFFYAECLNNISFYFFHVKRFTREYIKEKVILLYKRMEGNM